MWNNNEQLSIRFKPYYDKLVIKKWKIARLFLGKYGIIFGWTNKLYKFKIKAKRLWFELAQYIVWTKTKKF